MEPHDLLILYRHELFANGIVNLLRVHGLSPASVDLRSKDVFEHVHAMHPRVILVEDNDTDRSFATKLGHILKRNPHVGVIRIDIQNNRLGIYSAEQVTATDPQDLLDAINRLVTRSGERDQLRAALLQ